MREREREIERESAHSEVSVRDSDVVRSTSAQLYD
jgi:hypothetical protein